MRSVLCALVVLAFVPACEDAKAREKVAVLEARVGALETEVQSTHRETQERLDELVAREKARDARLTQLEADRDDLARQLAALRRTLAERPGRPEVEPTQVERPEEPEEEDERKIGVPECDAFVEIFAACIDEHPPGSREALERSLSEAIKAYKTVAADPVARDSLVSACEAAQKAARATCPE